MSAAPLQRARACLALLLCAAAAAASAAAIVAQDDRGRRVELAAPPQRIVSLVPSLTETVCALGACGRLVGIDRHSDRPAAVEKLPRLGGLEDTQIERLVSLKPDLVLVAGSSRALDRLVALGLPVLALEPQSLSDTERVVRQVAAALGEPAAGETLWQRLQGRVSAAARRVPASLKGARVYFEVASTPFAAGEASFVGALLSQLGLANVVPASLGSFPQLNPEFVVRAQPDLVMASSRALAQMPARPGWATLRALREGRSCGFEKAAWDSLVRPGPGLADGAEAVVDCLQRLDKLSR